MKRIILIFSLILCGFALFGQIPRIRLNQVQKDTLWGSILISSPVDSNLTYSRDFYIGPDTSLNFYGTVLVAGGGGGGSFVTTTILSDSLANYILKVAGFGGDVSGTYDNITVIDDSHNHIISNVDGLQTALDGKLTSVNAGYGLTGSGTSGSALLVDTSGTIVSKNFYFANLPAGGGGTVTSVSAGTQISGMSMTISNPTTTPSIATSISDAANFRTAIGAGTLSSEVDGSVTNEGTLGVSSGTGSTSVITSNTSGANGVTITAAGINSISESTSSNGGTITITATEVDGSVSNEGSLSVGAGGANSSDIVSNTSGSTNVTISGGSNVTVTESGSTITIASTGGGSSFNNLTETADTVFVAKYLNVDTSTLYVDAINNRVGIGTTAPDHPLHVVGNILAQNTGAASGLRFNRTDGGGGALIAGAASTVIYADSTKPLYFAFEDKNVIATGSSFGGYAGFGLSGDPGSVRMSVNSLTADYTFHVTAPTGSDRIYLTGTLNDGNELSTAIVANSREAAVGVYKPTDRNPSGFVLLESRDADNVYLYTDSSTNNIVYVSTTQSNIGSTTGNIVGAQSSDKRLKTDLGDFPYGLNEIMALSPVQFTYKDDYTMKRNIGFYAQDVLPYIPEAVYDTKEIINDGETTKLGMQYVMIIPVLVKSIQEQQSIINQQQTQINDLLQRIIQLENK